MKKFSICLAIIIFVSALYSSPIISGKLQIQLELKEKYNKGILKSKPTFFKYLSNTNIQNIFLHFYKKPTKQQLEILKNYGILINLHSWVPAIANHPTGYYCASMPAKKDILNSLKKLKFIARIETAENIIKPNIDLASSEIGVTNVVASDNLTGEGTIISVIDSGFELGHPDLPSPIVAIDYSDYEPANPDSDFTVSNQHTGTPHGTYVAGIMLSQGNLSNGRWTGLAKDADWLGFKVAKDYTGSITSSAIIHSIRASRFYYNADFINLSLGGWDTFHDGSGEIDQMVDWVSSDGCCVFCAAGNDASKRFHTSGILSPGETSDFIRVNPLTSNQKATYMFNLVWFDSDNTSIRKVMNMEFFNQNYHHITLQTISDMTQSPRGTESRTGYCITNSDYFYIVVTNYSNQTLKFHIYSDTQNCNFENDDENYTINYPATADMAFAIAAYTTRNEWYNYLNVHSFSPQTVNDITSYSSKGPRIDEIQKIFLAAPGSMIISLRDHDDILGPPFGSWGNYVINNLPNQSLPADYIIMEGTSAACPVACAGAALLKSYYHDISRNEILNYLSSNAKTDEYTTSNIPNNIWGYGKINIENALNGLKWDLTPLPPQNVNITIQDDNMVLSWDPVTQSRNGTSITANYRIFVFENPFDTVYQSYFDTNQTHIYLYPSLQKAFYKVTAIYDPD